MQAKKICHHLTNDTQFEQHYLKQEEASSSLPKNPSVFTRWIQEDNVAKNKKFGCISKTQSKRTYQK